MGDLKGMVAVGEDCSWVESLFSGRNNFRAGSVAASVA
jgi:hypothetical protein